MYRTLFFFCLNILKDSGNAASHQICSWALSFAQGLYLNASKCCWKIVHENNGSSLIISPHDTILFIFTIEPKRVSCGVWIYTDHEKAICCRPHSIFGQEFRIIRNAGYEQTFCGISCIYKKLLFLIFAFKNDILEDLWGYFYASRKIVYPSVTKNCCFMGG